MQPLLCPDASAGAATISFHWHRHTLQYHRCVLEIEYFLRTFRHNNSSDSKFPSFLIQLYFPSQRLSNDLMSKTYPNNLLRGKIFVDSFNIVRQDMDPGFILVGRVPCLYQPLIMCWNKREPVTRIASYSEGSGYFSG